MESAQRQGTCQINENKQSGTTARKGSARQMGVHMRGSPRRKFCQLNNPCLNMRDVILRCITIRCLCNKPMTSDVYSSDCHSPQATAPSSEMPLQRYQKVDSHNASHVLVQSWSRGWHRPHPGHGRRGLRPQPTMEATRAWRPYLPTQQPAPRLSTGSVLAARAASPSPAALNSRCALELAARDSSQFCWAPCNRTSSIAACIGCLAWG